jgi:PAS domain S-box-containing protein
MATRDQDELEPLRLTVEARENQAETRSPALRRMVAQLVLETTNEGIWLIDAQERTTFVNQAAAALIGYREDEMIGRHIFDFMDAERLPVARQNLMLRRQGVEDRQEIKLRRKDGSFVWAIGSANPVYDRDGNYAGALALIGDLSSQKQTEDRLRARIAELIASYRAPEPQPASSVGIGWRVLAAFAAGGTFISITGILTIAGIVGAMLDGGAGGVPPPEL